MRQRITAQELAGWRWAQRLACSKTSEDDLKTSEDDFAKFRSLEKARSAPGRPGISGGFRLPLLWLRRIRHRRAIASLTEAQLSDVGLSRDLVARESAKYFWQE